jgi:hypothetical protein
MSRSYREPWCVDGYGTKRKRNEKRRANRVIRKAKNVPSGRAYRKYIDQYQLCDYRYLCPAHSDDPDPWSVKWYMERFRKTSRK